VGAIHKPAAGCTIQGPDLYTHGNANQSKDRASDCATFVGAGAGAKLVSATQLLLVQAAPCSYCLRGTMHLQLVLVFALTPLQA
jgi:hypothetical protein